MDSKPTTVYRLRNNTGDLLYVGIAGNPGRRFEQHAGEKPWWGEVAAIDLEHHTSRQAAAAAEMLAIKTERPRYNIVGNRLVADGVPGVAPSLAPDDLWTFSSRRGGFSRTSRLSLVPEINGTAISDDWLPDEISAGELFGMWRKRFVGHDGMVSIYWSVQGDGVGETAPFQPQWGPDDFLTHFTWPRNANGERLNWNRVPVLDGRWYSEGTKGGFFQEHTGWKPVPFMDRVHVPTVLAQAGLA